jgi:hypothetical protein
MKTKIALGIYASISLLGLLLLLAWENIYVIAALILGMLLLGHRELWSLIRHGHMPVIDERVRDNLSGAMRLTGIFFFIASIVLLLLLRFNTFKNTPKELLISGEFVIIGIAYIIAYYYYDRVRPGLGEKALRWLRICLTTAGLSLSTGALAVILHNLISAWSGMEEAVFFILAVLIAPAVFVLSLLGCLGIYLKGLFRLAGEGELK